MKVKLLLVLAAVSAWWGVVNWNYGNRTVYHFQHPSSGEHLTVLVLGGVSNDHAWIFQGQRESLSTGWPWERYAHVKGLLVVSSHSHGWVVSGSVSEEDTFGKSDSVVICPGDWCPEVLPDSLATVFRLG
jgi:hypothetical protein